jgi:hypothetical protein
VRALAIVAAGIALAACHAGPEARAEPVDAELGRAFVLAGGQRAAFSGEGLHVRFADVLEDSRCPTEVECFWTGQARITVAVDIDSAEPVTVEFNTNPAPTQKRQTVEAGDYVVMLQSLDPYPREPGDATGLADYRATLVVRRVGQ